MNPKMSGPFAQVFGFAFVRNQPVYCGVLQLLLWCCPAAIPRLIVSVHVNPIQRGARWPLSHVGQKGMKLAPARADGDTSSAIPVVGNVLAISASLPHGSPTVVGCRATGAVFDSGTPSTRINDVQPFDPNCEARSAIADAFRKSSFLTCFFRPRVLGDENDISKSFANVRGTNAPVHA